MRGRNLGGVADANDNAVAILISIDHDEAGNTGFHGGEEATVQLEEIVVALNGDERSFPGELRQRGRGFARLAHVLQTELVIAAVDVETAKAARHDGGVMRENLIQVAGSDVRELSRIGGARDAALLRASGWIGDVDASARQQKKYQVEVYATLFHTGLRLSIALPKALRRPSGRGHASALFSHLARRGASFACRKLPS